MRFLADSNVVVSMFVFASFPELRDAAGSEGFTMLLPSYCIGEVRRVVAAKWPGRAAALEAFLAEASYEEVPDPGEGFGGAALSVRDPEDLPVLRAALAGRADAIVTGDRDFAEAGTGGVPVYTPAEFAARFL